MKKVLIPICIFFIFILTVCKLDSKIEELTGSISGVLSIKNEQIEKYGFTVTIPGTSFTSVTDKEGIFTISDVPASDYSALIIQKGDYSYYLDINYTITAGETTDIGSIVLEDIQEEHNSETEKEEITDKDNKSEILENSLIWKGKLNAAPENPERCWIYYNTTDETSYIYDGNNWLAISNQAVDINELDLIKLKPEAPVFSVKSGLIDCKDTITISCNTPYANIFYALNGNDIYYRYTKPLIIQEDTSISAFASLFFDSDLVSVDYKIKTYEVTFHTNGSVQTPDKITSLKKGDNITLPTISLTGYTPIWYEDANFQKEITTDTITINKNTDLFFKLTPNKYKINYVFSEAYWALPADAPQYHIYGTETILPTLIETTTLTEDDEYHWFLSDSPDETENALNKLEPKAFTTEITVYWVNRVENPECVNNGQTWTYDSYIYYCINYKIVKDVCEYGSSYDGRVCNTAGPCDSSSYNAWVNPNGDTVACVDGMVTIIRN